MKLSSKFNKKKYFGRRKKTFPMIADCICGEKIDSSKLSEHHEDCEAYKKLHKEEVEDELEF